MDIRDDYSNCGLKHIVGINNYDNKPTKAMEDFCKLAIPKPSRFGGHEGGNLLSTFYFFSGALDKFHEKKTYASGFAAFIKANKLGQVSLGPIRPNKHYGDGHKIRAYVWAPNEAAVVAWWKGRQKKEPKK